MMAKSMEKEMISVVQLNDIREILHLRTYTGEFTVQLIGMDDFICYNFDHAIKEIFRVLNPKNILFTPENSKECAVAEAVLYVKYGGKNIVTSFAGVGNLAATEQVALALRLNARYKVNQEYQGFAGLKLLYEEITNTKIPGKMPIIGERIFWVESGIHVDGIIKKSSNYEVFPPELVGQTRTIVLGKHSGISSVKYKLMQKNRTEVSEDCCYRILERVKEQSNLYCRGITDTEFDEIIKECL